MGLYCKINLESDWGLPNRTPELGLPIDYTEAINVFSDTFMRLSQEMVPVDTGFLKSSLKSFGDGMTIEAEATADYAQYVEYGTWCCPAQPYFNPAVESASDAAFGVAKQIYDRAMEQEAEIVRQQLIAEAQMRVSNGVNSLGLPSSFAGLFAMMIVVGIITLFHEFFSDIFGGYDKED